MYILYLGNNCGICVHACMIYGANHRYLCLYKWNVFKRRSLLSACFRGVLRRKNWSVLGIDIPELKIGSLV
jgi:hypothetical protein